MSGSARRNKKITIIAIAAIAIFAVGSVTAFMAGGPPIASQTPQTQDEFIKVLTTPTTASAPALGSNDAKITIVEFGDYQCTWCMRFHQNTKDQLVANYVETGKVRFLFKDFPINDLGDKASSMAAEASYCAADQGKYWDYHDEVYSNWDGENTGWVTKESLKQFATNTGVGDLLTFSECLESGKYSQIVRDNYNLARSAGLNSTPSFLVISEENKVQLIPGAIPYSSFSEFLDKMESEQAT